MSNQDQNSNKLTLSQQVLSHLLASPSDAKAEKVKELVDEAILKKQEQKPRRKYIGASSLGDQCSRKIQYRYMNVPIDEGKDFPPRTLRIFALGHILEDEIAEMIKDAGFDLRTSKKDGSQFGFSVADDQIKGHIDGVICGGPVDFDYPCLWECKTANDKKFNEFVRNGVAKANPVYAAQVALYQAYMDLADNPALFTVYNKNTSEIYYEWVPFNAELAQRTSDKAANILTATKAGDILPRIAQNADFFVCKMCEFQQKCWAEQ